MPGGGAGWFDDSIGSGRGSNETDFSASNEGDHVDISGTQGGNDASASTENTSGSREYSGPGRSAGSNGASAPAPQAPPRARCITSDDLSPSNGVAFCPVPATEAGDPETPDPAAPPQIGLEDVASLAPSNGLLAVEPGTWALTGLAFNPVASAEPQTVAGELLGQAVEVRFTPAAFHWDYGDGTERSTSTGGGTWAQLGLAEFATTPTSHVYAQRGSYELVLLLEQRAEYRVLAGGGWQAVPGTVLAEAANETIEVGAAGTVLVDRDCRQLPRGPGC